jgi:hypothetical protein
MGRERFLRMTLLEEQIDHTDPYGADNRNNDTIQEEKYHQLTWAIRRV